jgi:hypothetical protein
VSLDNGAQLAPAGQPEVQGGADPLGGHGQAVAGGVADEEDAVLGGRSDLVRDPVALVANRRHVQVAGQAHRLLLDLVARLERADSDAQLAVRRERPRVARAHVGTIDPYLQVLAAAGGVDLEAP